MIKRLNENMKKHNACISSTYMYPINTPLGEMVAIASDTHLLFLGFKGQKGMEQVITKISKGSEKVLSEVNPIIEQIASEITLYFKGQLKVFQTPLDPRGTPFQHQVWNALKAIPYGSTIAYEEQACNIRKPKAFRAVASANGANPFTIIVPCHRVVNKSGGLGGYAGGLDKKQWLLDHERSYL